MELTREVRKEITKHDNMDDLDTHKQPNERTKKGSHTDIVYAPGSAVNLMDQNKYLVNLISTSINEVQAFITPTNAYPEEGAGLVICAAKITHKVAEKLKYKDVINHMKSDLTHKYQRGLACPVCSFVILC